MVNRRSLRRKTRTPRRHPIVRPRQIVSGRYFRPPNAVRETAFRPWNTYMLVTSLSQANDTAVSIAAIAAGLCAANGLQTSPTANLPLDIRIISLELYGMTNQNLTCIFRDLGHNSQPTEQIVQHYSSKNQYARIGYTWPLADQSQVFVSSSTQEVFKLLATGQATDRCLARLRLLWRSRQTLATVTQQDIANEVRLQAPPSSRLEDKIDRLCDVLLASSLGARSPSGSSSTSAIFLGESP